MNLAMIAFNRGDCSIATRFAERAVETSAGKEAKESLEFFAAKMKEFSHDPEVCRQEAGRFRWYGL
jgi:hypothetical protein